MFRSQAKADALVARLDASAEKCEMAALAAAGAGGDLAAALAKSLETLQEVRDDCHALLGPLQREVAALQQIQHKLSADLERKVAAGVERVTQTIAQRDEAFREALRQAEHWRGVAHGALEASFDHQLGGSRCEILLNGPGTKPSAATSSKAGSSRSSPRPRGRSSSGRSGKRSS